MMKLEAEFPPDLESAGEARRFARQALEQLGCEDLTDTVQLLVSELVVNAVLHASSPSRLSLSLDDERLRVEVADLDPALPQIQAFAPSAASGRGLLILDSLADEWGVEPSAQGKTVWFALRPGR